MSKVVEETGKRGRLRRRWQDDISEWTNVQGQELACTATERAAWKPDNYSYRGIPSLDEDGLTIRHVYARTHTHTHTERDTQGNKLLRTGLRGRCGA